MDVRKNYYRILQISEEADSAVVAAAYRALTKRYHPDVAGTGDTAVMREINEAYEVLSDPRRRVEYDRSRDRTDDLRDNPRKPTESEEESKLWALKCELYPEIRAEFESLSAISPTLANTFKLSLVSASDLERHSHIAISLRHAYLSRYFGNAVRLQKVGEALIRAGNREKAKELNHIVSALGPHLSEDQVSRVLRKVGLFDPVPYPTESVAKSDESRSWWLLYAIIGLIGMFWLLSVVASRR